MKLVQVTVLVEVEDTCPDPVAFAVEQLDELAESVSKGGSSSDEHGYLRGVSFRDDAHEVDPW